jgi:hypothetical protein
MRPDVPKKTYHGENEDVKVQAGYAGGEGGIRTHGPDINRNNRLAGDPDQPLQHLSDGWLF